MALIVHGGAKTIPEEQHDAHREGCRRAAEAGWAVLQRGGSSIDAVEAAIRVLEDDPTFNAGTGADLNADGEAQMDAGLMEGTTLKSGAVAFIQGVRHPISVARRVFESGEVLLAGDGARRFAEQEDAELCEIDDLVTPARRRDWEAQGGGDGHDTVGCVTIDRRGRLAAGASTGGTGMNPRGRVGDTPQIGCGFYADDEHGAVANTGDGEQIARVVLAKTIVDLLGEGEPDEVIQRGLRQLERRTEGEAGSIALDRNGLIGWGHNSDHMAVAYRNESMPEATAYISKDEECRRKS